MKIRFYLDENVQISIAEQLIRRGIDVVTVRDLGVLGDEDVNHLARATRLERVLCTHDADYIELASTGIEHFGIVIGKQHNTPLVLGLVSWSWYMVFTKRMRCET